MRRLARQVARTTETRGRSKRPRRLNLEPLESRRLLVAQGEVFSFTEAFDTSGFVGEVSAEIRWGDQTTSAATSVVGGNETGDLQIIFDYSLDAEPEGFFDDPTRRELLELAAETLISRMNDDLAAIVPTSDHQWDVSVMHPSQAPSAGQEFATYDLPAGPEVPANTIIIYAGARDLPGTARGIGGPSTSLSIDPVRFECSTQAECDQKQADFLAFQDAVRARGNAGGTTDPPTDFAPGVGSISFDNADTNWFFNADASAFPAGDQVDFLTIAIHELAHVLGYGVSGAWAELVTGGTYSGPAANAAYQGAGNVPLQSVISGTPAHWNQSVLDLQPSLLTPSLSFVAGDRTEFSALDFAGLDDIGWEVVEMEATVSGEHQYQTPGMYTPQVVLTGDQLGEIIYSLPAVTVTATETLTASFDTSEVSEDSAAGVDLTLVRGDADTSSALVVTVGGGPSGQLNMPATITIPADQSEHTITVMPVNDAQAELTKELSFTFTAANHENATAAISVLDDEPPLFQNPTDRHDVAGDDGATANDALRIINELFRRGGEAILDPELEQPDEVYYDVNGDYRISALDALNVINELPNRASSQPETPLSASVRSNPTGPDLGAAGEEDNDRDEDWAGQLF